jgi:hypothetical protein
MIFKCNFDLYTPPQWNFNEFWIIVHGSLSQWSRGFLLVIHGNLIEPWIFFSYCVVLYAFFDLSDYYPKFIKVPLWYLICEIKTQGDNLQSSSDADRGMYHWVNPVMYHVTFCEILRYDPFKKMHTFMRSKTL